MSSSKTISVAMCTYNGEKFLKEQLDSIAAQTRLPDELVVSDDRSTDATQQIIEAFARGAPFPVRLTVNPVNLGAAAKGITRNFENTVQRCTGAILVPCDQDDVWFPQKLARMAQRLEDDPGLGGIFSDARLIDGNGISKGVLLSQTSGLTLNEQHRLAQGEALPILLSMTKVYGCTLMFKARLLDKILPVPPHWWFDAWVACMVAMHSRLAFTPEPLFCYRIHATQSVGASVPSFSERIRSWRSSARQYWKDSEPQLAELYVRLAAARDPSMQLHLEYIQGRMDLLRFRAELPSNPIARAGMVLRQAGNYRRYFNGSRSMMKDLTI